MRQQRLRGESLAKALLWGVQCLFAASMRHGHDTHASPHPPRPVTAYDGDERSVVDLLVDQVEFADVIVLNKLDLVDDATKTAVKALLHRLNPGAKFVECTQSRVPLENVLNTKLFSLEKAARAPGWLRELRCVTCHGARARDRAEGRREYARRATTPRPRGRWWWKCRYWMHRAWGCGPCG